MFAARAAALLRRSIRPRFPAEAVPRAEIDRFADRIMAAPDLLDPEAVRAAYGALGVRIAPDPFGPETADAVAEALRAGRPFSVVRIGDGEANLLAMGAPSDTPNLDAHMAEASLLNQADRFPVDRVWLLAMRDLLRAGVASADVVGLLGLWTPDGAAADAEAVAAAFRDDLRGVGGQFRGRLDGLAAARAGAFDGRLVASAHCYFGVAGRVTELAAAADRVLALTNRPEALTRAGLERAETIPVGLGPARGPAALDRVWRALPRDLSGALALVGAGPWAEIYCGWIRERGGVAVDLGSGFDLLAGDLSRPIHRAVDAAALGSVAGPRG